MYTFWERQPATPPGYIRYATKYAQLTTILLCTKYLVSERVSETRILGTCSAMEK